MSLPDATRSDRIYPLLQNLDLENLAFATLQGTGETLNIEEMNEDELRRLVLVNLARLSVKGEWNGLLTASSGGTQYAFDPIDSSLMPATYAYFSPMDIYRTKSTTVSTTPMQEKAQFFRFVAPKDGTMGLIKIRTGSTNTAQDDVNIAIYSSTSGLPSTRVGLISIDVNGTADLYSSSSWTTAPTLTAGDTYWIGFASNGTTRATVSTTDSAQYLALGLTHYPGTGYATLYNYGGTDDDLPSTITTSQLQPDNSKPIIPFMYQYA